MLQVKEHRKSYVDINPSASSSSFFLQLVTTCLASPPSASLPRVDKVSLQRCQLASRLSHGIMFILLLKQWACAPITTFMLNFSQAFPTI